MTQDTSLDFNLTEWRNRVFPETIPGEHMRGDTIVGPYSLACVDEARRIASSQCELGPRIPADVFVLSLGSPQRRDLTQIGGAPYRPVHATWPRNTNGVPHTFLAQVRLKESLDILPSLPGDVLLVFAEDHDLALGRDSYFHFEWQRLGATPLVDSTAVPSPTWRFIQAYGTRYRTFDCLDCARAEKCFRNSFHTYKNEVPDRCSRLAAKALSVVSAGIKVGGKPAWLQGPEPGFEGARFLFSISTFSPRCGEPFPFLNRPQPFSHDDYFHSRGEFELSWFDGCEVYFFLDAADRIVWTLQLA